VLSLGKLEGEIRVLVVKELEGEPGGKVERPWKIQTMGIVGLELWLNCGICWRNLGKQLLKG